MSLEPPRLPPDTSLSTADGRILLDAALLKRLRKARGLSQEALAELCFNQQLAVSIASIKRAETGNVVLYRTARHLAEIFDIPLERLIAAQVGQPAQGVDPDSLVGAAYVSVRAAAPAAAAAIIPPVAAPPLAELIVRYVIELHLELAAPLAGGDAVRHEIGGVVQQFGGRLEDGGGQQLIALFGLPQAYRSDAERGMRCAIELGRRMLAHGGRAMALRLLRWENGQAGHSEHAAPDLRRADPAARAPAGAPFRVPIYVAANVVAQLGGRFEFEAGPARFGGYQTYRRAAAADTAQLPPLIGRYAEIGQFKALIEAVREGESGHIVYLRAMAGVGKTRLAQEFADIARQHGMRHHGGEVQDAGADSWRAPLEQLARSLFGLGGPAPVAMAEQAIDDTLAQLGLPQEWLIFYRAVAGARMSAEQMALYAAMSHEVRDRGVAKALQMLILRLAMREPLLLVIEDVHWGDPYLFEALGALLTMTRDAPVLWVLTSRLEQDPLETTLRPQLFELALTVFDLAPLGQREAAVLADQFGDTEPAYRRRCVERAQGNALFLTQLLASPEQHLPDSLKHLIQSRLDGLAPEHRGALRMAAVIGNRFDLALLREALGAPDYEPQAAGRNCLVRPVGAGIYVFVHDLVMHCIYESIDAAQLQRLHRIVAHVFRERDPAQCAQHLYAADDPNALEMMLGAIRGKLASHQFEAALDLTAECHAADSTSYSSFALALLGAHATAGLGQMSGARQGYQQAMLLAGRPQDKIDAVIGLATTLNILDQLDEEEKLLDETVPLAQAIGADGALGKLLHLKGNIYFPRGNYAECRRYHEDAARYAKASAMTETQARALSGIGDSYYAQGRMLKAHALFSECIAMCEQHRYPHIEASNRSALGSTSIYLGQPASAIADALASADIARKVGNRRAETFSRMTAGWALLAGGQLADATREVGAGLELARSMGSSRFEPFLMESEARIAWLRGDRALAEQQILAVVEQVERQQLQGFIGPWMLGTLALFSRDAAVRKKALLKGAAYLTRDCLAHNGYRFYATAAEVAMLDGDLVAAEFYADQLAGYAALEPCSWVEHHVQMIRQFSRWLTDPDDKVRVALRGLRAQADEHGYTQTMPRLREALDKL